MYQFRDTIATIFAPGLIGLKQTKLPGVVSFQSYKSAYVGTDPRLANSSQVLGRINCL